MPSNIILFQVQGRSGTDCRIVTFDDNVIDQDMFDGVPTRINHEEQGGGFGTSPCSKRGHHQQDHPNSKGPMSLCRLAIRIDELSRLLFPLSFVVFNIFYWTYYTQWA